MKRLLLFSLIFLSFSIEAGFFCSFAEQSKRRFSNLVKELIENYKQGISIKNDVHALVNDNDVNYEILADFVRDNKNFLLERVHTLHHAKILGHWSDSNQIELDNNVALLELIFIESVE